MAEKAGPAVGKAVDKAEVAGTVSEKAGPAVEKAKDSAGELVGKVKERSATKATRTKVRALDGQRVHPHPDGGRKAAQVTDQVRGISGVVAVDPSPALRRRRRAESDDLDGLAKERSCRCRSSTASPATLTCPVIQL